MSPTLPLIKNRPHKKSPYYRIARRKVSPADNLPAKIQPARAAAGRGGFLPVNCRPGENFSAGGPIIRHRPVRRPQPRPSARRPSVSAAPAHGEGEVYEK